MVVRGLDRNERILLAVKHYKEFRSMLDTLMTKFDLTMTDARNVVVEANKRIREEEILYNNQEREIEGMVWEYNPERDIKDLTVPQY
jgi:polyhydroxyalkanoate synthesis regulator phasin